MKKLSLFLATGALLALASCQPEADSSMTDAQIDSMVNARVEEIRMQMMAQNDSLINAMAQTRADSILAAMKGGNSVVTKKTTTTTTTVKPTTPTKTPTQTTQAEKFEDRKTGNTVISEEKKQEQSDKFKNRGGR